MCKDLKDGLHCKACDSPLTSDSIDVELCNTCMQTVIEYNKDLLTAEEEKEWKELCQAMGVWIDEVESYEE